MVFKSPAAVDRRTAASIRMGSNGTHSQEYHIPDAKYIRKDLLSWYSVNKRLLPWRHEWEPAKAKNTDWLAQRAYAVWVSEIMLQQTQVTTVVDYFRRWMIKWPDVFALANATLEDVNRVWSGLGYYSRAKRLHQGAQIVVSKFGGQLPTTAAALEKHIPGIGPYTAGAIASIAFNEHAPLVDGNVIRVLSRLCAIGSNPKTKASVTMHWKTAGHLLDPDMPGDFNQAMMDLGATVCTPKTPQCTVCPLKTHCLAFAEQEEYHALQYNMGHRKSLEKGISTAISPKIDTFGVECVKRVRNSTKSTADSSVGLQGVCSICPAVSIDDIEEWPVTRYPLKVKRKPSRLQQCAVAVIELYDGTDDRRVLVAKSPETGLLAGLWDFPIMIVSDVDPALNGLSKDSEKGLKGGLLSKAIDKLIYQYVGSVETILREDLGSVVHIFSHIRRTMFVQYIRIRYQDASVVPFALSPSTGKNSS
ncbi:A/G-specific adenine glycosylase [Batrachochytrium salamandrivorans]|nr:A/G-specific adenine glycosylase [Batrachochytrium salamandrivorans]